MHLLIFSCLLLHFCSVSRYKSWQILILFLHARRSMNIRRCIQTLNKALMRKWAFICNICASKRIPCTGSPRQAKIRDSVQAQKATNQGRRRSAVSGGIWSQSSGGEHDSRGWGLNHHTISWHQSHLFILLWFSLDPPSVSALVPTIPFPRCHSPSVFVCVFLGRRHSG